MNEFILVRDKFDRGKILIKTERISHATDIYDLVDLKKEVFRHCEIELNEKLNNTIICVSERAVDIYSKINAIQKY